MVRAPCCDKMGVKRGPWTTEEDHVLVSYIQTYGHGNWRALPKDAGLNRCGKSCRLRWINYLRPDIKRGNFTVEEEEAIIRLHAQLGNRWSVIAAQLPGRTDNEIKNFWHTYLKKRLPRGGSEPEPAEKQRSVKPSPKTDQPLPDAAVSPATLIPEQLQQPGSENTLLLSPVAKDEPRTSCSSSWISTVSRRSDEFVDFSSVEVADLDEAFWTEALATNSTVAEDQAAGECAPCGGRTTGIGSSLPVAITARRSQCASATTSWTAETPSDDGTDFWLRLLVGAGNLPR